MMFSKECNGLREISASEESGLRSLQIEAHMKKASCYFEFFPHLLIFCFG